MEEVKLFVDVEVNVCAPISTAARVASVTATNSPEARKGR